MCDTSIICYPPPEAQLTTHIHVTPMSQVISHDLATITKFSPTHQESRSACLAGRLMMWQAKEIPLSFLSSDSPENSIDIRHDLLMSDGSSPHCCG